MYPESLLVSEDFMTNPTALSPAAAPVAAQQPKVLEIHGDRRIDPYYWLRDRSNSEVITYLEAENAYTQAQLRHTEPLQTQLYEEMLGRIQETDLSVPYRHGDYFYYSRTESGKAYGILCRKRGSLETDEEILLDQNQLAEGEAFFSLGDTAVSPNHQYLAYATDTNGSESYTLQIKDLTTDTLFTDTIQEVSEVVWANDNQTLFYVRIDSAHRPFQLWRHQLGADPTTDVLLYEESDEGFYLGIDRSRSNAYILLSADSKITSEVRFLDANQPLADFQLIHPRETGVEYWLDHHPGDGIDPDTNRFYIVTNDEAINFKLMVTPIATPEKIHWQTVLPHRPDVLLADIDVFANHLVRYEREKGLPTIWVQSLPTADQPTLNAHRIAFPEPTYSVYAGTMAEFHSHTLRFTYTSLITPSSVFDYDMTTHERELKKETPVLGGYDRAQYTSEWLMATASDGTAVPISLVYKKGIQRDRTTPLFLTGYGSYGYPYPVTFSSQRLSLLDRGVVCAIAHIRGGGEMGRPWYEDGKFLHKKNTFTDFIACAEYLITEQWTCAQKLVISGGSAGGLLMGAVLNMRPDLFQGAIAAVPFVDVVTTILDPSLPLSVLEWEEWGNPNDPKFYDYMKSYSPYDNVKAQDYPHLLITAGLNDPRVSYWEPAKWTAKLRTLKTDTNRLVLKTNMDAGHSGASGRYGRLQERALDYAFVLDCLGLTPTP
ncbi:MAG: S9 family peptidase [Cyanothece sp. SIO2G6]|nr:S9 family peptidase [Cyanothece sp. SIO2G6]